MRTIVMIGLIGTIVVAAVAAQPGHHSEWHDGPYREEAEAIMNEWEDRVPAQLTFGEVEELAGQLSIPAQKAAYVAKSQTASMIVPGTGQFMNDEPLAGALFLAGDLVLSAGTLVGVYFLMPEALRFDRIDYLNTPKSRIKDEWVRELEELSLLDSLPIAGVLAGGMILDAVLSGASARHAGMLARNRIASGAITFEPRPEMIIMAGGRLGLGMSMSY